MDTNHHEEIDTIEKAIEAVLSLQEDVQPTQRQVRRASRPRSHDADEVWRREVLLAGREGSRRRQRWLNDRLADCEQAVEPTREDWAPENASARGHALRAGQPGGRHPRACRQTSTPAGIATTCPRGSEAKARSHPAGPGNGGPDPGICLRARRRGGRGGFRHCPRGETAHSPRCAGPARGQVWPMAGPFARRPLRTGLCEPAPRHRDSCPMRRRRQTTNPAVMAPIMILLCTKFQEAAR